MKELKPVIRLFNDKDQWTDEGVYVANQIEKEIEEICNRILEKK